MKLNLKHPTTCNWPRKEWQYVIDMLKPYQSDNGILVDGFIDATFGYWENQSIESGIIPYEKEWIGFWHHPPKISPWLDRRNLEPKSIIEKDVFQTSMNKCRGIFTFSNYLASHLQEHVTCPVESLFHPTQPVSLPFDFSAFARSKQILQIGSWLRKLSSFYRFKAIDYNKIHLIGLDGCQNLKVELHYSANKDILDDVQQLPFVDDSEYNNLLSNSIVFIDLYDSSVNNTIIECIARDTPIIVNRIEPVVEYLGENYPLYYHSLSEVPYLLEDIDMIYKANKYLQNHNIKAKLTQDFFVQSFLKSNIICDISR